MNRRILVAAAVLLASGLARAGQLPQRLNFQGRLTDPATNLPKNGAFTLTFKIYPSATGGAAAYTETQANVPVNNGVFSVQIGSITPLDQELFSGASAYLGITVSPDPEMTPRQYLVMAPYAFTAEQLSQAGDIRLNAGTAYSTFTAAGNLLVPAGVNASSAAISGGLTASSGTYTASGGAQFSIQTSSGIRVDAGTLALNGGGGLDALYGLSQTTIAFKGLAADPSDGETTLYYNTSTGTLKLNTGGSWGFLFPQSVSRLYFLTTDNTAATAAKASAATILVTPLYLPGPMVVNKLTLRVTTALGAAGDVGIYDLSGALVLDGGSGSVSTTAGAKIVTPAQAGAARFLPPGQYFAAVTWNSAAGVIGGDNMAVANLVPRAGALAAGGGLALPASITPSSIVNGTALYFVGLLSQ